MRYRFALIVLICAMVPNFIQAAPAQGLAITDPHILRDLDNGDLGLGQMLAASRNPPLTNEVLFAQPAMAPLRRALEADPADGRVYSAQGRFLRYAQLSGVSAEGAEP